MLLEVKNLTKHFAGLTAVNHVSLHVREGEILAIVGPNGAGKSVLFGLISGLIGPSSGEIHLQGERISGLKPHRIARKGIARTFQTTSLFDQLRVVDNLAIGYRLRTAGGFWNTLLHTPSWKKDKDRTTAKVMETLGFIGLGEKAFHFVSALSQAEQERLSIGVALISQPKMILLDEPSMELAPLIVRKIIGEVVKAIHEAGTTIFLSEQNARMALMIARRGYVLETGRIVLEGSNLELMNNEKVKKAYIGA